MIGGHMWPVAAVLVGIVVDKAWHEGSAQYLVLCRLFLALPSYVNLPALVGQAVNALLTECYLCQFPIVM